MFPELAIRPTVDYTFEAVDLDMDFAYNTPWGLAEISPPALTITFIGLDLKHDQAWDMLIGYLSSLCSPNYVKVKKGVLSNSLLAVSRRPEVTEPRTCIPVYGPAWIDFTLRMPSAYRAAAPAPASIGTAEATHIIVTPDMLDDAPTDTVSGFEEQDDTYEDESDWDFWSTSDDWEDDSD